MVIKAKTIIAVIVAFILIATIAVVIIMTHNSGEEMDNNLPSTVATESASQSASETLDDNELEIFIDNADAPRDDISDVNNASENKTTEENSENNGTSEFLDDENTQKTTSEVKAESNLAEESTVDFEQAIEDALSGEGEPIVLPMVPVD